MIIFYAAADAKSCENKIAIIKDIEDRLVPVILDEIKTNVPKKVEFIAAAKEQHEVIDDMISHFDGGAIKDNCHLMKISISIDVELIRKTKG